MDGDGGGGGVASIFEKPREGARRAEISGRRVNAVLPSNSGADALSALRIALPRWSSATTTSRVTLRSMRVQAYEKERPADQVDKSLHTYADFVGKEYAHSGQQLATKV